MYYSFKKTYKIKRTFIYVIIFYLMVYPVFDTSAQIIHTVSINPKIPAQYDDLQTAFDAANANDIIYIHPAEDVYAIDSLLIDKPITLIGGGFYNDARTYAGEITQFEKIRIKPVSGLVKIANLAASRIIIEGNESNTHENVRVEYVNVDRLDLEAVNSIFLSNSLYIINSIIPLISFENWTDIDESARINIENNILGQIANGGGINLLIRNNLFNPAIFGKIALANLYNATVVNNIFFGDEKENAIGITTTDFCIYERNLSYQTSDSFNGGTDNVIGNNNFNNRNPSFTSVSGIWDTIEKIVASNFTLVTGSPAIGSGTEGTNIGISGGEFPFNPRIRYGHPHVKSINVNNPVLGESDTLRFTIEGVYPNQN